VHFSVQLPTDRVEEGPEFTSRDAIFELAASAERARFDACYVTEHPFPSDPWLAAGGHHALDPFVSLAVAAAATTRLRLHTNILVLAYRNPFLTAKSIASLDAVSDGRVIVGVAAGYLEGEYQALGADFAHRNEITDEALVAMKMLPCPVQRPHPPLWVGGNTRAAMRRAAEHGQGWSPFPLPASYSSRTRTAPIESVDDLREKIDWLSDHAAKRGRSDPLDVNFVPFGHGMNAREALDTEAFCEQAQRLEAIGVTWLSVGLSGRSRAAYCESLARFGDEVIAKLR
jgi:alkanesulfonate monooxygenase SsuD/methylene tetrahydromethanopterin reductase-like flavin-dependent oxidoreductase (luciferase family)